MPSVTDAIVTGAGVTSLFSYATSRFYDRLTNEVYNRDARIYPPAGVVSIVIPAFNEEDNILTTLKSILTQNILYKYKDYFECIVVDNESTDRTADIARQYCQVISAPRGKLNARDAGIKHASGDIIVSCDADCLTENAEILTEYGWKHYTDLYEGLKILTLNTSSNELEYNPIQKVITHYYTGQVTHLKNKSLDAVFTPNHRCLISTRTDSGYTWGKWKYINAINLPAYFKIRATGLYNSGKNSIDINLLRLCAWIITEGYFKNKQKKYLAISQSTVNIDYVDTIRRLLDELNFSYSECWRKQREGQNGQEVIFSLSSEVSKVILSILGNNIHEIPRNLLELPLEQLDILYSELLKGDGSHSYYYTRISRERKERWNYFSSKQVALIDQFQELCTKIGVRTLVKKSNSVYLCYIASKDFYVINKKDTLKEEYSGIIWCVTVNNSNFVARQNGSTFITGNCYYPPNWLNLLIRHFHRKDVVAVYSPHLLSQGSGLYKVGIIWYMNLVHSTMSGSSSAFLRKIYFTINGFDLSTDQFNRQEIQIEEEMVFPAKLKTLGKVVFELKACCFASGRHIYINAERQERTKSKYVQEIERGERF